MANTIGKQVLANDSRNYIIKYTIIGDGSGEQTATIFNATTGDMGTSPRIVKIDSQLSGFSAQLLWDANTPLFAVQCVSDFPFFVDYNSIGGLPDNASTGKTGDLKITTSGLGTGDSGSIILWAVK